MCDFEVHFGGPDQPHHNLRNLLLQRISRTPAGHSISMTAYYLRDRPMACALLAAQRRGVDVRLTLAGKPRTASANAAIIEMLAAPDGLGRGLSLVTMPGLSLPSGLSWRPQVHAKLYCFSYPQPTAYIGSYNPSGDEPEERPEILREIGDQNLGHNLLIGVRQPELAERLFGHARQLHQSPPGIFHHFSRRLAGDTSVGTASLHFWPRVSPNPILQFLRRLGAGAHVRIAASHIRSSVGIRAIRGLAKRGATVEILAESTLRRVTASAERRLLSAGVAFQRLACENPVPMHLKFILVEAQGWHRSITGSFNWSNPSFWLNHEIALMSEDSGLYESLDRRWRSLR